jgi:hypothetical protein
MDTDQHSDSHIRITTNYGIDSGTNNLPYGDHIIDIHADSIAIANAIYNAYFGANVDPNTITNRDLDAGAYTDQHTDRDKPTNVYTFTDMDGISTDDTPY